VARGASQSVRLVLQVASSTAQLLAPGARGHVDAVYGRTAYTPPRVGARLLTSAALVLVTLVDERASRTDPLRQTCPRLLCWNDDVVLVIVWD